MSLASTTPIALRNKIIIEKIGLFLFHSETPFFFFFIGREKQPCFLERVQTGEIIAVVLFLFIVLG